MHDVPTEHAFVTRASHKVALTSAMALIILGGALGAQIAHAQLPPTQHYNQIEYVSGGIGIDESTAFRHAMSQFPLALTFAEKLGDTAAYISDVLVVIRTKKGDTVLKADADGPYFLVRLPAGSYEVSATYESKTMTRTVNVGTKGSAHAVFEW